MRIKSILHLRAEYNVENNNDSKVFAHAPYDKQLLCGYGAYCERKDNEGITDTKQVQPENVL
jgi:hypothetical protein